MDLLDNECDSWLSKSTKGQLNDDVYDAVSAGVPIHLRYKKEGFDFEAAFKPPLTIKYRVAESLPLWKKETDVVLKEIDSGMGKHAVRRVDASFTFDSCLDVIAAERAKQNLIPPEKLQQVAQAKGFLLPKGGRFNISRAVLTNDDTFLHFTVERGEKRFSCLQYPMAVEWTADGELASVPFGKSQIMKSLKYPAGVLLRISNGAGVAPSTLFIHRSGQAISADADLFEDKEYREMVGTLAQAGTK